ncbi:MAG TPA: hypothetical protein VFS97_01905 [Nitrososphaeraceae archaeon]|nr:hypothetical protein [Nitrososphaeraceae archaeon]
MRKKDNAKKRSLRLTRRVSNRGNRRKESVKSKHKPSKKSSTIKRTVLVGKNKKTKKATIKQATNSIQKRVGTKVNAKVISKTTSRSPEKYRIVRIMGQGQFTVDNSTLKRLNEIDASIVQLVSKERYDDIEFRKHLTELTQVVETKGKPLDPKEIIQSDIILPSTDLSIDEAKRLFRGEGVIPEI